MDLDDPICLCFHVSRRKLTNFVRVEKPRRPSQLSNCFGAGTGCGWCRPFIERIFDSVQAEQAASTEANGSNENSQAESPEQNDLPSKTEYAQLRTKYVREGLGKPPTSDA